MNTSRSPKVLCSVGVGAHARLLQLSKPTLEHYARTHGYDLVLRDAPLSTDRPPAWQKVLAVQELLETYETVVWVDADAIIVDAQVDIAEMAGDDHFLWITEHQYGGDKQPNTGVMVIRRGEEATRFFQLVWESVRFIHHPWWEQAAILALMGYDVETAIGHATLVAPSEWFARIGILSTEWNSIPLDSHPSPRIRHYAGTQQGARIRSMSADLRAFYRSQEAADPTLPPSAIAAILPLHRQSPEAALSSLVAVASEHDTAYKMVLIDDAAQLDGIFTTLIGAAITTVQFDVEYGLSAAWQAGVAASREPFIVLLRGAVQPEPGVLAQLAAALADSGVVAAVATSEEDAALSPEASFAVAVRRCDLDAIGGVPQGQTPGSEMSALCLSLAATGRRVISVPTAVVRPPLNMPRERVFEDQINPALLDFLRASYAGALTSVPCREELPVVFNRRGLVGVGVEIGVQQGLFSHHILTNWAGSKLVSVDPWSAVGDDEWRDIANVAQDRQDALHAQTCQRLAIFGDRSEVLRDFSVSASRSFADGSLAFVYLYAHRAYDAVTADLQTWFPKVMKGGIIAGHYYLDGDPPDGIYGIKSAVIDFFRVRQLVVHSTLYDAPRSSWIVEVPTADGVLGHTDTALRYALNKL